MSQRMITRAIVWLLIVAWSLTGMHLTLVSHGLSGAGALVEAHRQCHGLRGERALGTDAPASGQTHASLLAGLDVLESQVDHVCTLAELLKTPVMLSSNVVANVHVSVDQPVDQLFGAHVICREVLERAPKGSPPQV